MDNKTKFLRENVGFHSEDLSIIRQTELENAIEELGLSAEWVYLALSRNPLSEWEKWGFNLFKKPEFRKEIDSLLTALNKKDDNAFKKERSKNRSKKGIYVSADTFYKHWNGVKAQGRLYTHNEAAALRLTDYWTYGNAVKDKAAINFLLASEEAPGEDDWVTVVMGTQHVKIQEAADVYL